MQPRGCWIRDCERNVEAIDLLDERVKVMGRGGGEATEADAIAAGDAVQRAGWRGRIMPMRRMRDRIEAEREHKSDEQGSRPLAQRSDLMEKAHEGRSPVAERLRAAPPSVKRAMN